MDERDMRYQDGRNPYGSEGGYVVSSRVRGRGRSRRGDRAMQDYGDMARSGRGMQGGRGRDMGYDMARVDSRADYRSYDMRGYDMRGGDRHHMQGMEQGQGSTYYPIQAMGTFEGYYGMPNQQDYARSGRRDYGYDMGNNYNRQYMDYGYSRYDYGFDYGESDERLSEEELEHWCKKLKGQLDDREKQMFSKEVIIPKFKQMGIEMKDFNEEELYVMTLAKYTDHKQSIGQNPDLSIKLARDFMVDKDSKVTGGKRVAIYYDDFVAD
jgi:hypothetical protein